MQERAGTAATLAALAALATLAAGAAIDVIERGPITARAANATGTAEA